MRFPVVNTIDSDSGYTKDEMRDYGQQCRAEALTKERDELMQAAKLALDALQSYADWEDMGDPEKPASDAIAALKKAGV